MKFRKILFAAAAGAVFCAATYAADAPDPKIVERGKYIATIGGCDDCHTPKTFTDNGPQLDTTRLLSGHPSTEKIADIPKDVLGPTKWGAITNNSLTAWVGPWGVSFTANLTPDLETGLGSWTEDMFIKAMRTGKHMGSGRPILPPMPWQAVGKMTDEDLKSLFTFLKSLPPVKNAVPDPIPPAPAAAH